jgi:hypothetical protein
MFVWASWTLSLLCLLVFVAAFSGNVPLWDEWQMIPTLLGAGFPDWQWLWQPWSEHRVPLVKVVLIVLFKLSGGDFRAPLFFNVALLGITSASLIEFARRLRGRTSYTDVFFPLVFLTFGHEDNLFQGWNLQNVAFTFLAGLLLVMSAAGRYLSFWRLLGVGVLLLLLPLDGAAGVGVVPAMVLWLLYAGFGLWHCGRPRDRRNALVAFVFALAACCLIVFYFHGLTFNTRGWPGLAVGLTGALKFWTTALGPATKVAWPLSGIFLAACLSCAVAGLLSTWIRTPQNRLPVLALLCLLAGIGAVSLAIGWSRTAFAPDLPFHPRYALVAAPGFCCIYCAGSWWASPTGGRILQVVLAAAMVLATPMNFARGWDWARQHRAHIATLENDVVTGMPANFILMRHDWLLAVWNKDFPVDPNYRRYMEGCLKELRKAGIGVFGHLRDMPPSQQRLLNPVPGSTDEMTWRERVGRGSGTNPTMTFTLDRPQKVYGMYLECSLDHGNNEREPAAFQVSWKSSQTGALHVDSPQVDAGKGIREVLIWMNDTIDRFQVRPDDRPCTIEISRIILLVPAP